MAFPPPPAAAAAPPQEWRNAGCLRSTDPTWTGDPNSQARSSLAQRQRTPAPQRRRRPPQCTDVNRVAEQRHRHEPRGRCSLASMVAIRTSSAIATNGAMWCITRQPTLEGGTRAKRRTGGGAAEVEEAAGGDDWAHSGPLLLSTPAAASTAGSPRWGPLMGGEGGFGGPG